MSETDLRPAVRATAAVVAAVPEESLAQPTPCPDWTVADLLDHLGGLAHAFTLSARKEPLGEVGADVDGSRLEPGWRDRIIGALQELGEAWATTPGAFEGETRAGPVELPAAVAALVALDEVVVHGWDLAVATGTRYDPDPAAVAAARGFVDSFEPPEGGPADDGDLFGRPVDVAAGALELHHLLGAAGRDPAWTPDLDSP